MLILTRRIRERILIGDDIVVEVSSLQKNKVRLAIYAPRDVLIIREELLKEVICQKCNHVNSRDIENCEKCGNRLKCVSCGISFRKLDDSNKCIYCSDKPRD